MFTLDQIKAAHSKVKTGADFPAYIKELKQLGIIYYENKVSNGVTTYSGEQNYHVVGLPRYEEMVIEIKTNADAFKGDLKEHQDGKTDYMTFCKQCAKWGIEKWVVQLDKMTCTYFDKAGNEILAETIPS